MPIVTAFRFKAALIAAIWLFAALVAAERASAQASLVTFDDIKRISPTARDEYAQAMVDAAPLFAKAGINTRLRMAHFLAQVMTETGGLKRLDENMNYSYKTLIRVFSRRTISDAKARQIAGRPVEIANWVYGARLGNRGRTTQDGWNYRGSGFIQLTGRTNFRLRGQELALPLEDDPELARKADAGLQAAIGYWTSRGINAAADNNDHRRVRILVNGPAAHGLDQARIHFSRVWTRVFAAKPPSPGEVAVEMTEAMLSEADLFDNILIGGGILSEDALATEAGAAEARAEALREVQRDLGLPETGVLDEATQDALLDPREWRHLDEGEAQAAEAGPDAERSVIFPIADGGGQTAATAALMPEPGSGAIVADPNLPEAERQSLGRASGIYARYEMGDADIDPETFTPFSVIGQDERVAVTETVSYPARAVVQILFETASGSQRICTGAMVGPHTVLTAGHCLHSGTSTGQLYRNFRVIPGRNVGAGPFGACRATRVFVLAGWTGAQTGDEARYYDLGGLRLDCEVGRATGWLGVRALADAETGIETVVHGYAADLSPPGRQWISRDRLHILWDLKGFYQNDTFGGTSGSPVLAGGAPDTIIGVHTNGLHGEEPWASFNAFTRITPERLARIRDWIGE